jgi:alanine dehydrogenase
VCTKNLIHID